MADRAFFIATYLSPLGRSAKMPAVFHSRNRPRCLQNEKSATGFPRRGLFCRRESPPKASPGGGRP
jgi:hypothetical protein